MKNIFKSIGLGLVAGLFLSACANQAPQQSAAPVAAGQTVAFINTDSLILNYKLAQKLNERIMSKEEAARADFNQKYRTLQQDAAEFQRKVQNNAFLSMERAQQEQNRLQKKQQELQELDNRLSKELLDEQAKLSSQLHDTLQNFLKEYASTRYSLVLSNNMGDNVLWSAPGVDITNEVIEILNSRYKE
ncbi:MAG: OmpH family outer membrane protein [Bacteroidales bacterium]|nr:OmpH family outer membrane protein [Bacteroidales bacterium]